MHFHETEATIAYQSLVQYLHVLHVFLVVCTCVLHCIVCLCLYVRMCGLNILCIIVTLLLIKIVNADELVQYIVSPTHMVSTFLMCNVNVLSFSSLSHFH